MTTNAATRGALFVVGTASGVGKSTVAAALCRSLSRRGVDVAPFKAQNMSNHAAVTADGGEVGVAQALQARAAGIDVTRDMNPILLKPSSDRDSHVVVLGEEVGRTDAAAWGDGVESLRSTVLAAFGRLTSTHAAVVAEGAGGAAEVNLLARDLVNLPLAAATGSPAILVVDIDRGGAFASAFGTVALLPSELRSPLRGIVINRFRGDPSLLTSGIRDLEHRTGLPVLGVLPYGIEGRTRLLGVEDSLDIADGGHDATDRRDRRTPAIRVAAIRLPHLANPADLDPLAIEDDVALTWTTDPAELATADLVVVPGSRATVADLDWLRRRGLDAALADAVGRGATVLGICAGAQVLGRTIDDPVESRRGTVPGLGLAPYATRFATAKVVERVQGSAPIGEDIHPIHGFRMHLGRLVGDDLGWIDLPAGGDGWRSADGAVLATSVHGILDADGFRTALCGAVARRAGRDFHPVDVGYRDVLDRQLDAMADWLDGEIDPDTWGPLLADAADPADRPGWPR